MLSAQREPVSGVQLWCKGRDYGGRTSDATDATGNFNALVAQFDSTVDIEVSLRSFAPNDDSIEVYFEQNGWHRKLPKSNAKILLEKLVGKYIKGGLVDGLPTWHIQGPEEAVKNCAKKASEESAKIVWCQKRHQWQHIVKGSVVYSKEESSSPVGAGWQLAPSFQRALFESDADREKGPTDLPVGVPIYSRVVLISKRTVGPFQTGPAGKVVDLGELIVE